MRRMPGFSVVVLAVTVSGCGGCVNDEPSRQGQGTSSEPAVTSRPAHILMTPHIAQLVRALDGGSLEPATASAPAAPPAAPPAAAPGGS